VLFRLGTTNFATVFKGPPHRHFSEPNCIPVLLLGNQRRGALLENHILIGADPNSRPRSGAQKRSRRAPSIVSMSPPDIPSNT
jgi:hypothetical protein